jgi:hypothetical protein
MDLFTDLPVSKSPRLLWMERHGIKTIFMPASGSVDAFWIADFMDPNTTHYQEVGDTEDDALTALAKAAGIRMWFEEVRS